MPIKADMFILKWRENRQDKRKGITTISGKKTRPVFIPLHSLIGEIKQLFTMIKSRETNFHAEDKQHAYINNMLIYVYLHYE